MLNTVYDGRIDRFVKTAKLKYKDGMKLLLPFNLSPEMAKKSEIHAELGTMYNKGDFFTQKVHNTIKDRIKDHPYPGQVLIVVMDQVLNDFHRTLSK